MDYWIKVLEHSARGVVTWSQHERRSPSSDKRSAGDASFCHPHHCSSSPGGCLSPGMRSGNLLKGYMNVSGQCKLGSITVLRVRMGLIKKSTNNKCWRGCGVKGTLWHCWWEYKLIQPLWKRVWRFLKKLGIKPPYDPAIPLLSIYPEETKIERDTCIPLFIAALFTTARTWKQPRCSSTDEWIRKLW